MVFNAFLDRENKSSIKNEIEVAPEFRHIFTDKLSVIGRNGRTIKELRPGHKSKPGKYQGRKVHVLKF